MAKTPTPAAYNRLLSGIAELLDSARRTVVRRANAILTTTYWEIGRRIIEHEQHGRRRADYGEQLIARLAVDLTQQFGRGFSKSNLFQMRSFFSNWEIFQTPSGKLQARVKFNPDEASGSSKSAKTPVTSKELAVKTVVPDFETADVFPLSWSHYVRLMSVEKLHARAFYEVEAIRGGWSVRQLDRQISTQLFNYSNVLRSQSGRKLSCRKLSSRSPAT